MVKITHTRKHVVVTYSDDVKGSHASVSAVRPGDGEVVEKKEFNNVGHVTLSFPMDYHGACQVEIHGSRGGTDEGLITI